MDKNTERLYLALLSLCSVDECEDFLGDLLTPKELSDLTDRLSVAALLSEGVYYNDIANMTGASTATISRVSKCLAGQRGGYRRVLARLTEAEESRDYPTFTLAVPDSDEGLAVYRATLGQLPFMPPIRDRSRVQCSEDGGIRILLADPRDVPALLCGGACNMALCSEWSLRESGVDVADSMAIGPEFSLRLHLSVEQDSARRVATSYPITAGQYTSARNLETVELAGASSAVSYPGFDGYCDISPRAEARPGEELAVLRYLLVFGATASAEVTELLRKSLS